MCLVLSLVVGWGEGGDKIDCKERNEKFLRLGMRWKKEGRKKRGRKLNSTAVAIFVFSLC